MTTYKPTQQEVMDVIKGLKFDPDLTKGRYGSLRNGYYKDLYFQILKSDAKQGGKPNPEAKLLKDIFGDPDAYEHSHTREHVVFTYGQREEKAVQIRTWMFREKKNALDQIERNRKLDYLPDPVYAEREKDESPEAFENRLEMYRNLRISATRRHPALVKEYQTYLTQEWRDRVARREEEIHTWYKGDPRRRIFWACEKFLFPMAWNLHQEAAKEVSRLENGGFDPDCMDIYETMESALFEARRNRQVYSLLAAATTYAMADKFLTDRSWEMLHTINRCMLEDYRLEGSASGFTCYFEDWDERGAMFLLEDSLWWADIEWKERNKEEA